MNATARRAASVTLVVSAALALSGCHPSGTSSNGAAPAASSATNASSTAAPTASAASAATDASSPTAAATSKPAPTTSVVAISSSACKNLVATTTVRDQVTRTYAAQSKLVHIAPAAGSFLYGECGGTTYAASRFEPTSDATEQEKVASQDEGSVRKYFSLSPSGSWTYLGSAGFPDTAGCITQIPHALAMVWADCKSH